MRRNEVWWAQLPEPVGRRPVLLLSRNEAYAVRRKVVVAEITTRVRGTPCEVRLGRREGLAGRSVVNLENLVTVPRDALVERAGVLPPAKVRTVDEALRFALALA